MNDKKKKREKRKRKKGRKRKIEREGAKKDETKAKTANWETGRKRRKDKAKD